MKKLNDEQIAAYYHRSYTAVDGLWFVKVEERNGFDTALEIDDQVWQVLPKIQARMIKSMLNLDDGIKGLADALVARLELEGFDFEAKSDGESIKITVKRCPWHEVLVKSGREHLSNKVGSVICMEDNSTFAKEFGDVCFDLEDQICSGSDGCVLRFTF